jgi:hypothetical protein
MSAIKINYDIIYWDMSVEPIKISPDIVWEVRASLKIVALPNPNLSYNSKHSLFIFPLKFDRFIFTLQFFAPSSSQFPSLDYSKKLLKFLVSILFILPFNLFNTLCRVNTSLTDIYTLHWFTDPEIHTALQHASTLQFTPNPCNYDFTNCIYYTTLYQYNLLSCAIFVKKKCMYN